MHFARGTSFQASLHPWMPKYEIPGDVTGIGNKCEHPRWMCPCTGTCTPGVHRVPARRAAHVAPSPALLPWLCHWALAGYHLRWSGHHSRRRYVLFKGLHKSWQRSMPENLDRRISNLAHRTCRFVPVAWPYHTLNPTANFPVLPASATAAHAAHYRGKACPLWGRWHLALPLLAEHRCELVETGCQKPKGKAGLEPAGNRTDVLMLFLPAVFATSNRNKQQMIMCYWPAMSTALHTGIRVYKITYALAAAPGTLSHQPTAF